MSPHRRLAGLLIALLLLALPAVALRAGCVGRSCDAAAVTQEVPFCGLPPEVRTGLVDGYREGRSPDVVAVTPTTASIAGPTLTANGPIPWPADGPEPPRAPLVFSGQGVRRGAIEDAALEVVAPTLAAAIGLDRPFPEIRSGTALPGVVRSPAPRLLIVVAWKGVGPATLEADPDAWPSLRRLLAGGAGTIDASIGSLPIEPAAVLTTIGTGAVPRQHGVTGPIVRDDAGAVVPAFGPSSPTPVLASLGDDMRHDTDAMVALVSDDPQDAGLVGVGWYQGVDPPPRIDADTAEAPSAIADALAGGFGRDDVPDLIGVALDDEVAAMDEATREIAALTRRATGGSVLLVVVGTGSAATAPPELEVEPAGGEVAFAGVEPGLIAGIVAGGMYLEQAVLAERGVASHDVVDAVDATVTGTGEPLLRDVFQDFAVSFNRYCG